MVKFRDAAVHADKVGKSFTVDTVIDDKYFIARLCQGSAGSFQS